MRANKKDNDVAAPSTQVPIKITPQFPQCLKKKESDAKYQKFLRVLKNLSVNIPLVDALIGISGYDKYMKEMVTKKRRMEFETLGVSHNCSTIMTRNMITEKNDMRAFTILCIIGGYQISRAYLLGASVNLMPLKIFKKLWLNNPKATTMRLLMTD